jgi:DNA/RNA-binding domain of Phe-tRNA-synthetase-like protein
VNNYQLKIAPCISEKFPEYSALIIYACGLVNKSSDEYSTDVLRAAEQEQRSAFGTAKPASHPHIAAWRQAYKSFGAKPSKHLCAVEALLSRTLKGHDLPTVNYLVDLYNAVSIRHVLPVGGEDWDRLTSDLTLTLACGEEPFVVYESGEEVLTHPEPGEVIWADSTGVTCRRFNWRQCHRTQLIVDTKNTYFVFDCLPPYSIKQLMAAGEELIKHLKSSFPNCTITHEILGDHSLTCFSG